MAQRNGRSAQRSYLITIVLAVSITGVANVLAQNWPHLFPKSDPAESPPDEMPSVRDNDDGLQVGPSAFGRWVERQADTVYQAEADGFVAAYTGGNHPADEFVVDVGVLNKSNSIDWGVRTRAGRYDGTVCPVSRGDHWRVRSFGAGTITVHWLPIQLHDES